MTDWITIDGSQGEGGGQILRTSLSLSLITGTPVHFENVRAGRRKPGLLRQHLTAIEAATTIGNATCRGAELGARAFDFRPGRVQGGDYRFAVGTAGSATLVAQTILPALLNAPGPSCVVLEGGTHNPMAPPFEFLERVFLPWIGRMGGSVSVELERAGFYPAGGGRFRLRVEPARLAALHIGDRGELTGKTATALVAALPPGVAQRELDGVARALTFDESDLHVQTLPASWGPGNALLIQLDFEPRHRVGGGLRRAGQARREGGSGSGGEGTSES